LDELSEYEKKEGPVIHISSQNALLDYEHIPLQHKAPKEGAAPHPQPLPPSTPSRLSPAGLRPVDGLPTSSSALFAFGDELISTSELISRSTEAAACARGEGTEEDNKGSTIKEVETGDRSADYQFSDLPAFYSSLAKSRLTALVVASALAGYALAPVPLSALSLAGGALGTALVSASANTVNQLMEVPYDAVMKRTKNRVLVKQLLSRQHVVGFAGVCAVSGVGVLLACTNPTCALLGLTNLVLYTAVYTPVKRVSIANTWVGAVVGAIPPLIGWTACGGALIGPECYGAWLMAGLLFAWQFPHFNALSWNLRKDYSTAGYHMMCHDNPRLCKVTCLRYSAVMLAIGFAAPLLDVTTWMYACDATPFNLAMLYLSYRFYRDGDSKSSRRLFRFTLLHLPAVLVLMIMSRKYESPQAKPAHPDYSSKVVYVRGKQLRGSEGAE